MLLEPRAAEEFVIGACLLEEARYWQIAERLTPAMFSDSWLRGCFAIIRDLTLESKPLKIDLVARRCPDEDGDARTRLLVLIGKVGDDASLIVEYADEIVNAYQRREMDRLGEALKKAARARDTRPEDALAEAQASLSEATALDTTGIEMFESLMKRLVDQGAEAYEKDRSLGFLTGVHSLDQLMGPIASDDFILLGGGSGGGKTALAMQIALHVSQTRWVDFVAIDQPATSIGQRVAAQWGEVSTKDVRSAQLDAFAVEKMVQRAHEAGRHKLRMVKKRHLEDIRHHCQAHHRGEGLGLVVIDHLKRVRTRRRHNSQMDRIEEVVNGLEEMRHDLGVPIILLSQLTRASQSRDDPSPQRSDLFGGGVVDEAADTVVMVWQPAKNRAWRDMIERRDRNETDPRHEIRRRQGQAQIILAKDRSGEDGRHAWMAFNGAQTRFEEIS